MLLRFRSLLWHWKLNYWIWTEKRAIRQRWLDNLKAQRKQLRKLAYYERVATENHYGNAWRN